MSIILSGLIHLFRPLLSSLSGALDCEGLGPWYFLLGLRIVAIFFSNGPWDKAKEDVTCNWVQTLQERSLAFCTALCNNQHFAISISATWGLVFLLNLLYVGLMRLSSPEEKKEDEKEKEKDKDKDKDKERGLAVVATAPHSDIADISTVYTVGRHGVAGNNAYGGLDDYDDYPHHHLYHPYWAHWHRSRMGRMGRMGEGYGPFVPFGPYGTGGYGGGEYGMPGAGGYGMPSGGGYGIPPEGGYRVPSEGGYSIPSEGGYGVPSDGGYRGPSEGGYVVSSDGGYSIPSEGGYGVPSEGGYGVPSEGGYGVPSDGGYRVPSDGGYRGPSDRGYRGPSDGGYGMPSDGEYGVPSDGGYGMPSEGGYGMPSEGGYRVPTKGGHAMPDGGHIMPDDEGRSVPAHEMSGVSADGSYSMPAGRGYGTTTHPEHTGKTQMPAYLRKTAQGKMGAGPVACRQTTLPPLQHNTSPLRGRIQQTKAVSRCQEAERCKVPTKSVPVPSPYRGKYKMATKCRPVIEGNVDGKENMALKRRQVRRNNVPTKSPAGFRHQAPVQPQLAQGSNMAAQSRPDGGQNMAPGPELPTGPPFCCHDDAGCPENNSCCSAAQGGPSRQPSGDNSSPGPQEKNKKLITNLCGVPFFDIWVGLLLATEIVFLCVILVLQMPSLLNRSWVCNPRAASCPPAVECVVSGRSEKRVALWGLVLTCCLFIVACSGYFYLRTCWNKRCCRCCREGDGENQGEGNAEPEGQGTRGDVEGGGRQAGGGQ